jgi:hypothetical protein
VTVVGLVVLTVIVGLLAYVLHARGLQYAAGVAGLVSVLFALPALVIPLVVWWQRRPSLPAVSSAEQVHAAVETLAGVICGQWIAEAAARSLGDPVPMPVRWRPGSRRVMDHPRLIATRRPSFSGRSDRVDQMVTEFRALTRRRLVILGEAGSGKTTLAVQLLLELLGSRRATEPVPVLLSLANWDTRLHPRLHDWLAKRLAEGYPSLRAESFGPDAPGAIARQSLILPILDGFDELDKESRTQVLSALNKSLTDHDQLIMTCRTAEYADAVEKSGDVLTAAAVIEAVPLTPGDVARYLASCISPGQNSTWQPVLTALRAGNLSTLAKVLSTPLGLWLLRAVYITPHADPAPLLDRHRFPDKSAVEAHLLDQLIPSLINTHTASRDRAELFRPRYEWSPEDAHRRLTALAQDLLRARTRDYAWWRVAGQTLAKRVLQSGAALVMGVAGALAVGSIFGLKLGVAFGLGTGLAFEVWARLGINTAKAMNDDGAGGDLQIRRPLLLRRLGGQFGLAAVLGLGAGLAFGIRFGALCGLGGVQGVGLAFASSEWLDHEPGYIDLHLRKPLLLRRLSIQLGYALVLGIGVASGLAFGMGYALSFGLIYGGLFGFGLGTAFALIEWAETPTTSGSASTPSSTLHSDRALTILRMSAVGLGAGLPAGLAFRPIAGIIIGLAGGFVAAFVNGSRQAWAVYVIATVRLSIAGRWPRRTMTFLEDAHRLGLLRTAGPMYQFRHAALQDHLGGPFNVPRTP